MNRFSAKEAKELAGKTVTEKVDALLVAIKEAAKNKKRSLRTSYDYKEDENFWVYQAYDNTPEYREAKKQLEELGYKVSFYYNAGQFVDMYTLIEW